MMYQFSWFPTVSAKKNPAIEKANSTSHRYIHYIAQGHGGGIVIQGTIGERVYFFYSVRDAMMRYNAEAKRAAA